MTNIFRRITSSGRYIPEIDGLRFIAISSVLLLHAHAWLVENMGIDDPARVPGMSTLAPWLLKGGYGVEVFFIISGFILSLPLLQGGKFSYRTYLVRRLTRLEPPYIISLLFFAAVLLLMGRYSFSEVWPELLASLVYLNNLIFPEHLPLVNGVTWSLEIEVQFYLLCPVIGLLLRKNKYQVWYYVGLMLVAMSIQKWAKPEVLSLLSVGSYFLLGFVLAYFYQRPPLFTLPPLFRDLLAFASFILMWVVLVPIGKDGSGHFAWYLLEHVNLFLFFYLVLVLKALPVVFSNTVVATIGGMCYSIYLLHFPLMSFMGKLFLKLGLFGGEASTYYVLMFLLITGAVAISSVFYLFLERPFMKRDWHKDFLARMRGKPVVAAAGNESV